MNTKEDIVKRNRRAMQYLTKCNPKYHMAYEGKVLTLYETIPLRFLKIKMPLFTVYEGTRSTYRPKEWRR